MKASIKIVMYIVLGFSFSVFCVTGCSYLTDPTPEVKLKQTELEILRAKQNFIIDSLNHQNERDLKMKLIEHGKTPSPRKGYEDYDGK